MSRMNEREIARKLAEREELEPPAGLLEKIKSEIPPSIPVGTEMPEVETPSPVAPRQRWLMAASVVAMIGAGLLALQVRTPMAPVQETAGSKSLLQRADRAPASPSTPPPPARMSRARRERSRSWEPGRRPPPPPPPPPKPLSRKETDELKSLGYVAPQGVEGGVEGGVVGSPEESPEEPWVGRALRGRLSPPCKRSKLRRAQPAPPAASRSPGRGETGAPGQCRRRLAADHRRGGGDGRIGEARAPRSAANRSRPTRSRTRPPSGSRAFEADSGTASYELVRRLAPAGQAARSGSDPRRGGAERL